MTVGYHDTIMQTINTIGLIGSNVFNGSGVFTSNIIGNLFWIISDVNSIWSQAYYLDFITMGRVTGDLIFRVFTSSLAQ